ncbi:MAG: hypothetical protein LBH28_02600 [Oscillospiraceae bacterium]|jgi:hypothetical protein|nr:hypothetical protein [Oscillospiraceae bacterium]
MDEQSNSKLIILMAHLCLILLVIIPLLVGCAYSDKNALIEWFQSIDNEKVEIYLWSHRYFDDAAMNDRYLSKDDAQAVLTILAGIPSDALTWNKNLTGITPEYGFHLTIDGEDYYINNAEGPDGLGSPGGQSEISFRDKLWWIYSIELRDLMLSLLEDH